MATQKNPSLKPLVNRAMTELQQHAFDALHADPYLSYKDYAEHLQVDRTVVRQRYKKACAKLGVLHIPRKIDPMKKFPGRKEAEAPHPALAEREPRRNADALRASNKMLPAVGDNQEALANVVYQLSDPQLESIAQAARELGLKPAALRNLLRKIETMAAPVTREIRDVRLDYMGKLLGSKAADVAESIDMVDIASASLRDKAIAVGILVQNKMLVEGKPTQRVAIEDRRHVNDLMQEFLTQAKYRGVDFAVDDGKAVIEVQGLRVDKSVYHNEGLTKEEVDDAELAP